MLFIDKYIQQVFSQYSPRDQRKISRFFITYFCSVLVMLYYVSRYNFVYETDKFNSLLLPILAINILSFPLFYISRNYKVSASICSFTSTIFLYSVLYWAGGIKAPSIFWIAIPPLIYTGVHGVRGSLFGILIMFLFFGYFVYVDSNGIELVDEFAEWTDFRKVKRFNLMLFVPIVAIVELSNLILYEREGDSLEKKKIELDTLLRVLIHDISTPLTVAKTATSLLNVQNMEQMKQKINFALSNISDQIQLIRDLQALEDGKKTLSLVPISINETLRNVLIIFEHKAKAKNVALNLSVNAADDLVLGNNVILQNQIFSNIVGNAIKFSNSDSTVELETFVIDGFIHIKISDSGIGIPKEIMSNIFDFNAQSNRQGTEGEKGTGYGLPLAKRYAENLQGSIRVDSEVNQGTVFTIVFPLITT